MALPQAAPGGGGRRPRTHFVYVGTAHGKNWHAWIAGPCMWFEAHTKGKSKPCLHTMTCGELRCERCEVGHAVEVIGYQPLYREIDAKPVMVIVHEYTREVVDALKLHQRVTVGRGAEVSDGVYVVPALNPQPKYTSTLAERLRPADLTETLLRVWAIPELVEWYRQTHGGTAPGTVPTPTRATSSAAPPAKVELTEQPSKSPLKRITITATGPTDEAIDAVMNRLKSKAAKLPPSSNGQH